MDYTKDYALIYDLVTSHKNYELEGEALEIFLTAFGISPPDKLLSIGCGTGSHELILSRSGYDVLGIDTSFDMINQANCKRLINRDSKISFICSDLHSIRSEGAFKAAISLFNVINCLGNFSQLVNFFSEINQKIVKNGLLFFEFWGEAACISEPPIQVTREFKDISCSAHLVRTATPNLSVDDRKLVIKYDVKGHVGDNAINVTSSHAVTLFTINEVMMALNAAGFHNVTFLHALPSLEVVSMPSIDTIRMLSASAFKI